MIDSMYWDNIYADLKLSWRSGNVIYIHEEFIEYDSAGFSILCIYQEVE